MDPLLPQPYSIAPDPTPSPRINIKLIMLIIGVLGVGVIGGLLISNVLVQQSQNPIINQPVACTMDAKVCPDGTSVGRIPPACNFAPCPLRHISPTQAVDEMAGWKTYINNQFGFEFKYPADWVLNEEKDGVRAVIKPDIRTVVGACPGYSFWAGKRDPYADYSIYTPLQQKTINNQNVNYYSKTNAYSCTSNIAFFNKSIIVSLISNKNNNRQLFNQILSTFKFTQ